MRAEQTFRVFISSTFKDWVLERDALHLRVWPKLQSFCANHHCRFQAIDLRWGISEAAARAAQTMRICETEIDRCRQVSSGVHFLALLGDRYGHRPIVGEIPNADLEDFLGECGLETRLLLVGDDEQEGWYRKDENALDSNGRPGIWRLRPRKEGARAEEAWKQEEQKLRMILCSRSVKLGSSFGGSATEQEINRALVGASGDEPILAFVRRLTGVPKDDEGRQYGDWLWNHGAWVLDEDASERLRALHDCVKDEESAGRAVVRRYDLTWPNRGSSEYLEQLCNDVYGSLVSRIEAHLDRHIGDLKRTRLSSRIDLRDQARGFVGRKQELLEIASYIATSIDKPMGVEGPAGIGKSSLLAQAALNVDRDLPLVVVIHRSCDLFSGPAAERELMLSILTELSDVLRWRESLSEVYSQLVERLKEFLQVGTPEKHVVIVLDAIDQLNGVLTWLPEQLSPRVRLIISYRNGTVPSGSTSGPILRLTGLSARDAWSVVADWLRSHGRTLQPAQREAVERALRQNDLPLFARLVGQLSSRWASYDPVHELPQSLPALVQRRVAELSSPLEHGPSMVRAVLSYLVSSRDGLIESDLLGLLNRDDVLWADFLSQTRNEPPEHELPIILWSRLNWDLEPFLKLTKTNAPIKFLHGVFQEIINNIYLRDEADHRSIHLQMADYFRGDYFDSPAEKEGLWHLDQAGSWQALGERLTGMLADHAAGVGHVNPEEELIALWKRVEQNTSLRASGAFAQILTEDVLPGSFRNVFLAKLLHRLGHDDSLEPFLDRLIHMCDELGNISDRYQYLGVKAAILRDRGDGESALRLLQDQESVLARGVSPENLVRKIGEVGLSQRAKNSLLTEMKRESESLKAHSLLEQAQILLASGNGDLAVENLRRAETIFRDVEDHKGLAYSLAQQGHIAGLKGGWKPAIALSEEAITLARDNGLREELCNYLEGLAQIRYFSGDVAGACENLEELAALLRPKGNSDRLRNTLGRIAEAMLHLGAAQLSEEYKAMGNARLAQRMFDAALASPKDREILDVVRELNGLLRQAGEKKLLAYCSDLLARLAYRFFWMGDQACETQRWTAAMEWLELAESVACEGEDWRTALDATRTRNAALRSQGQDPTTDMMDREKDYFLRLLMRKRS